MKKIVKIILFGLLLGAFSSCGISHDGRVVERTLHKQQAKAEALTADLVTLIETAPSTDTIIALTEQNKDIQFYIFNPRGLVYWSSNSLVISQVYLTQYDTWQYRSFDNAQALCRWSRAGAYNILCVIPLKYTYPVANKDLTNVFIPPFKASSKWSISRFSGEKPQGSYSIHDKNGHYLFSLYLPDGEEQVEQVENRLSDSFTYRRMIMTPNQEAWAQSSHLRVRIFYLLFLMLFIIIVTFGIVGIVHFKGFKNMRLHTRFQYLIITVMLGGFVYIFVMSVLYVKHHYETRQQDSLQHKAKYIQSALQNIYMWSESLNPGQTAGLNIDLHDLSFTYETDIHVYNLDGKLIGSSTPMLFEQGILSQYISSKPFFSPNHTLTQYEQMGSIRYLSAYTNFVNGNNMTIGYIAVPSFIAEDEINARVDAFLSRLLPPYLIVLVLMFLITFIVARQLTRPLSAISEQMRKYKIGSRERLIEYEYNDEVGELVKQYNSLVEELDLAVSRLTRSEREGAWKTMARQVAHEINNPLTPMKLTIQQLQRTKGTDKFDVYFEKSTQLLIEQIDTLNRIATSFSSFAKLPEVKNSRVDVAEKLTSVITLFQSNSDNVPIRYVGPESGVFVQTDEEQISQVFTNIIKNALQAMQGLENKDIIVILKDDPIRPQQWIEISFSDNGPGIPEDIQPKIFMPNFTTKSCGTGLGLAISKNIIEGSEGRIEFTTSKNGTNFLVYLKKK